MAFTYRDGGEIIMYQYPSYMYHYGVKGMKWGVRRARKSDRALAISGNRRRKNKTNTSYNNRWTKENLTKAKKTVDSASNITRNLNNINRSIPSKKRPKPMDLSNMSNKELQESITRANLERQYNDIYNPPRVSKGRKIVDNVLTYGGAILTAGSSALGIALAIKEFKG